MKTNSIEPLTLAQVKEIFEARAKEGELGYEQKQALEYAEKFAKMPKKESEKLVEKIMENKKVTKEAAVAMVNIGPKHPEKVKAIAGKDKIELTDDEANEIAKMF